MAKNDDTGRLRARIRKGIATVRVLLKHPMETGARQDPKTGELIPRHFIREVVCEHNGTTVLTLDWGWGVSANPYLSFDLSEGKPGDTVTIRWKDNLGETGQVDGKVT
jgi:sulfur-oxidizing protein SoxZ